MPANVISPGNVESRGVASWRKGVVGSSRNPSQSSFLTAYAVVTVLIGVFQLSVLDAATIPTLLAVGAVLISIVPAKIYGWRDMPSLIVLVSGARYATSALVWKTLELDPIDQGLYAPETSFTVVLAGTAAMAAAAFLCRFVWPWPTIFRDEWSASGLILLAIYGLLSAIATILVDIYQFEILGGINGLLISGFAIFPLAWLALNLRLYGKAFTYGSMVCISLLALFALYLNGRHYVATLFLAVAVFVLCFRIKLKTFHIVLFAAAVFLFGQYVAPAITDVRVFKNYRQDIGSFDFILLTLEQIEKRVTGEYVGVPSVAMGNYYLHYLRAQNDFTGRLVNVQQLDYMVALAASQGTLGYDHLWSSIIGLGPSVLVEDKTAINAADYALWVYGALDPGGQTNIENTTFGDAYAYGGLEFVGASVFVLYAVIFVYFRLFCPVFDRKLFAAFFVAAYLHFITVSSMIGLLGMLTRMMPFDILLFWALSRAKFAPK